MRTEDHAQYLEAVQLYMERSEKFDAARFNPNLSKAERLLLEARVLNRTGKWKESAQLLGQLLKDEDSFILAEAFFVRATAFSQLGKWQEALYANQTALAHYSNLKMKKRMFLAAYNASVDSGFLGLDQMTQLLLREAHKIASSPSEQILVLRAMACLESKNLKFNKAKELVSRALQQQKNLNTVDRTTLLIVAADIFVRAGCFDEAEYLLIDASRIRISNEKARASFELAVLKSYRSSATLLKEPKAVSQSKDYHLKWKILESLQSGQLNQAETLWADLCNIFPGVYAPGFKCIQKSDRLSIFFRFIEEKLHKTSKDKMILSGKRMQKLYELLAQSKFPIRKEEIIETLWGCSYDPELDTRFYKLIERLKKGVPVEIINKRGAYFFGKS